MKKGGELKGNKKNKKLNNVKGRKRDRGRKGSDIVEKEGMNIGKKKGGREIGKKGKRDRKK